jgi:hypothetical protein
VSDVDDGGFALNVDKRVARICRAISKQVQRSDAGIEVDVMHTWNELEYRALDKGLYDKRIYCRALDKGLQERIKRRALDKGLHNRREEIQSPKQGIVELEPSVPRSQS